MRQTLRMDPDYGAARTLLARTLAALHRYPEALKELGRPLPGTPASTLSFIVGIVLLADEMTATVARLNLNPEMANNPLPWIVVDFLYGITIVFAYAAMRPRFGAGPKTGVIAGLTPWFVISLIIFGFHAMGIFGPKLYITNLIAQVRDHLGAHRLGWGFLHRKVASAFEPS